MNWIVRAADTLRRAFRGPTRHEALAEQFGIALQGMMRGSAWNAAKDDRITSGHWDGSSIDTPINYDLVANLATMRTRSRAERQQNGILEGIVSSHVLDVVGPYGPSLHVMTEDENFRTALIKQWAAWWAMPDLNAQMSGPEMLAQDIRQEWDCGESVKQLVTDFGAEGPIKLRLLTIHPRRLATPYGMQMNPDVTLGVKRTLTGRPISYFIREDIDREFNFTIGTVYSEIPAANIVHDYAIEEPGQSRGIPRLASCLQVVAQLRDWDKDVQQAMRMAAMLGMFFYSELPDATPMTLNGSVTLEGGMGMALPPGYKPAQMTPQQPGQKYNDFRDAKLAEIGRAGCMPLMMVKLDSASHSYSSARFDAQSYDRAIKSRQARMTRTTMNRLLREFIREAQLARALPPSPADLATEWLWPSRPHVDPMKEASAQNQRLQDGAQTLAGYCAEYGLDADAVARQREREGLPVVPTWLVQGQPGEKPAEAVDETVPPKKGAA